MEKVKYFSVQRVRPSDLNTNTDYFEERINTNMSMVSSKGVIVDATLPDGTVLSHVNGYYLYNGGTSLGVYGLLAYDQYGKIVLIPKSTNTEVPDISNLKPSLNPEDNGLLVNTGGSFETNTTYTIVVRYTERYNETKKVPNDKTGIPTNYLVDTSFDLYARKSEIEDGIIKSVVLDGDIVLGTVTTDTSNPPKLTIDESNRDLFKIDQNLVTADVSLTNNVAGSTEVSLSSHINMLGSGTWSTTNPHAISAEDIGIDPTATGKHQQYLHSNGIKTDDINSENSALYTTYFSTSATSNDTVTIKALSSDNNEIVVVNGVTITPSDLKVDKVFNFYGLNDTQYAGFYICAVSSQTKTIERFGPFNSETDSSFLQTINDKTLFPICSFYWGQSLYPLYSITLQLQSGTDEDTIEKVFPSEYEFRNAYESDPTKNDYYIKAKDLVVYNEGIGSLIIYNGSNYWVKNKTALHDSSSYDIDPISIKDRRVFNNTGFEDIRTDTLCAMRDSAPFINNKVGLYYARVTSSEPFSSCYLTGTSFEALINGKSFIYEFTAVSEYTCLQIVDALNYQFDSNGIKAKSFIDHNNCLTIVATESIVLSGQGLFNEIVYFPASGFADYGEDLKAVINEGDLPSIQEIWYNDSQDIVGVYYISGGNTIRSHELIYSGDTIIGIDEKVEVK